MKMLGKKEVLLHLPENIARFAREFRRHLANFKYEIDPDTGLILFQQTHVAMGGMYHHHAPDGLGWLSDHNKVPTEGLTHIISVLLAGGTQNGTWYIAPFGANVTPSASWTAANFASNATELTTEYSEANRQEFVEAAASAGATNNTASKATFTAASDNVNIYGAGLLSASGKGATTGALLSAAAFGAVRNLPLIGDTLDIGLTFTATSAT